MTSRYNCDVYIWVYLSLSWGAIELKHAKLGRVGLNFYFFWHIKMGAETRELYRSFDRVLTLFRLSYVWKSTVTSSTRTVGSSTKCSRENLTIDLRHSLRVIDDRWFLVKLDKVRAATIVQARVRRHVHTLQI